MGREEVITPGSILKSVDPCDFKGITCAEVGNVRFFIFIKKRFSGADKKKRMLVEEIVPLVKNICSRQFKDEDVAEKKFENFKAFLRENGIKELDEHPFDGFILKLYTILPLIEMQGIDFILSSLAKQYVSDEKYEEMKEKGEKYLQFFTIISKMIATEEQQREKAEADLPKKASRKAVYSD